MASEGNGGGNERDTEDLSDEASTHRLQELRSQGKVFQSRELTGFIVLLATFVALFAVINSVGGQYVEFLKEILRFDGVSKESLTGNTLLTTKILAAGKLFMVIGFPVVLTGFVFSILGSVLQTGWVFSWDPVQFDWSKIDPIQGFQKLFSMRQFFEGIRVVFKIFTLLAIGYAVIKPEVFSASKHMLIDVTGIAPAYISGAKSVFYSLTLALLVFAGFDYWLQRNEYMKGVRLTKQEAKQEQKEHEGDPLVKARVRTIQKDMARKRMMQAVKKANVIITNPTHIAIAIIYERDKMLAPKVIAKGADFLAQRIKKVAADAGIPMVENVPLARTLFKSVKIGQYVPKNLYQAVAEVLAYVYKLKNHKF
ncbi:MAG: flagellar biosynthesis protein FlhB [Xanthomonadaceae bacterium]|nr:flagellar biosynthesis protein FlhB [Xanthomonadaceae bacterium]